MYSLVPETKDRTEILASMSRNLGSGGHRQELETYHS